MRQTVQSCKRPFLAALLYTGLTVIMTWPIAGQLGTHIPFSGGDAWVHLWTFHWIKDALWEWKSPFFTKLLFYPDGVELYFHNIAWVNIAVWLPLQAVIGESAAYSVVFMGVFTFNGYATYLLAREFTDSEPAAFIAGLIVAYWPNTLARHNHPNMIFIGFIPLAILYLKRFFERKRMRDAVISALFIALIGLTRWQLLIFGGFLIGPYVIFQFFSNKAVRNTYVLFRLIFIGLFALLLMAPFLLPVVKAQLTRDDPEALFVDEALVQTDLLGYILPNRYHPLWGNAVFDLYKNLDVPNKVLVHTIGYSVFFLAVSGLLKYWQRTRFWLLLAGICVVIALGPALLINGVRYDVPMPYNLVSNAFFIRAMRSPERQNVVLSIPVAMLAAYGVLALQRRQTKKVWFYAQVILFIAFILIEYIVAYPTRRLEIPDWYSILAQEPGDFGILGIPMGSRDITDKSYMYYQFEHGKPIVGGHVSRPSAGAFSFIESVPVLASFSDPLKPPLDLVNAGYQLRLLADANVRYVIMHKSFLNDETVKDWRNWFDLEPTYEDDELVVYKTRWVVGEDFPFLETNVHGLGVIKSSVSPQSTTQDGWININVRWGGQKSFAEDYDVCLDLINTAGEIKQTDCFPLSPTWPTHMWQENEIVDETYLLNMSPFLETGEYRFAATLFPQSNSNRSIELGTIRFSAIPRVFSAENEASDKPLVEWESTIALTRFDISQTNAETLDIGVDWLAQNRMNESYVLFVHLINSDTRELVAQVDAAPRNWSYPTNWWEKGEIVSDTLSLSLAGVDSGQYELWLGWYDIFTEERMQIDADSGAALDINNNAVRLDTLDLP